MTEFILDTLRIHNFGQIQKTLQSKKDKNQIKKIFMKRCHLTDDNLKNFLKHFRKLECLSLIDLKNTIIKNDTLTKNKKIFYLQILNCGSIKNFSLSHLEGLEYLDLSRTEVKVLCSLLFKNNKRLRQVNLDNCTINEILTSTFIHNKKLEFVNLSNNFIRELPKDIFKHNSRIREINLSYNKLLFLHHETFSHLKKLKKLNLEKCFSHCSYNIIHYKTFENTILLEDLIISDNYLTYLHEDIFKTLKHLKILDISNNYFFYLHDDLLKWNCHLEEFHITMFEENFLNIHLNRILKNCASSLKKIINQNFLGRTLVKTQNHDNHYDILDNLKKEKKVHKSEISNYYLFPSIILNEELLNSSYSKLEELTLNNLAIWYIKESYQLQLENLITFNANSNDIKTLPRYLFAKCKHLKFISLQSNSLNYLDEKTLYYNKELIEFDVTNNNLEMLPDTIFINNKKLKYIRLEDNPLLKLPESLATLKYVEEIDIDIEIFDKMILSAPLKLLFKRLDLDLNLYDNKQNVHDKFIQDSVRKSLKNILDLKLNVNVEETYNRILNHPLISEASKDILTHYCQYNTIDILLDLNFKEIITLIWAYIHQCLYEYKNDIIKVFNEECERRDTNICFTGKYANILNCLSGFSPLVSIEMSPNDQICNIIIKIKNSKIWRNVDTLKNKCKQELLNMGYTEETILPFINEIELNDD